MSKLVKKLPKTHHSFLAPSAGYRWLHCAGSAHAAREAGDGGSNIYAEIGTAAHELFEICSRGHIDPEHFLDDVWLSESEREIKIDSEMVEAVGHALDWVAAYRAQANTDGRKLVIRYEDRVTIGPMIGVSKNDCTGTSDTTIEDEDEDLAVILDYKHGAGVSVYAENNEQLMLYCLGVQYRRVHIDKKPPFKNFKPVIVQPRSLRDGVGPIREAPLLSWRELKRWARDFVTPRAQAALNPDAKRTAGDWCRWCPVASACKPLAVHALAVAKMDFSRNLTKMAKPKSADTLTSEELSWILRHKDVITNWVASVYGSALKKLQRGQKIPGYKLGYGRSSRVWADEKKAQTRLIKILDVDEMMPRKLVSVAQAEKLIFGQLGKKPRKVKVEKFNNLVGSIVEQRKGPLHVIPEEDKRPGVKPGQDDFIKQVRAKGK